jgi:integrase
LSALDERNKKRYVRSAGIKYLYRRGKIYYYVRHGKWTSLHTADRREARRRLAKLLEQAVTAKFLNESGLGHLLRAFAQNPSAPQGGQSGFLAANFANVHRPEFAAFTERFLARLTGPESQTPRMWKTCNNTLLELLRTLPEFGKEDLRGLDVWTKFLTLTPSGLWKALQLQGKGPSSLNHFASYLRKLVPKMVELGFAPASFATDAQGIKKLEVKAREPFIPSPTDMELLLRKCEDYDWELAQLPRAMVYSGARCGAFLHPKTGLRWPQVDFEHRDIIFTQKGNKRARVPMGPKLYQLLKRWQEHTGGHGDSLVFPFGSSKQDRIQAILKKACAELGGSLRDMNHFHAFKHYHKTQHQLAQMPDHISDFLTFNVPAGRRESGAVYRHADYEIARRWTERAKL